MLRCNTSPLLINAFLDNCLFSPMESRNLVVSSVARLFGTRHSMTEQWGGTALCGELELAFLPRCLRFGRPILPVSQEASLFPLNNEERQLIRRSSQFWSDHPRQFNSQSAAGRDKPFINQLTPVLRAIEGYGTRFANWRRRHDALIRESEISNIIPKYPGTGISSDITSSPTSVRSHQRLQNAFA